jgi:hypothetical protein
MNVCIVCVYSTDDNNREVPIIQSSKNHNHRYFLDRVATHILAFEGEDCTPFFWEGNFESYEENKISRLGLVEPKRIKFKPIPV